MGTKVVLRAPVSLEDLEALSTEMRAMVMEAMGTGVMETAVKGAAAMPQALTLVQIGN